MKRFLLVLLIPFSLFAGTEGPKAVWLTWQHDPTTTMTISWLTDKDDTNDHVAFRQVDAHEMQVKHGAHTTLPDGYTDILHRIELINLKPDTAYEFSLANYNQAWHFRTMPKDLKRPIWFVVGGDMYTGTTKEMRKTCKEAAKTNPSFAIIGGDIAYTGSRFWFIKEDANRWYDWLNVWYEEMVTTDGNIIPIVPAIGNHEVNGRFGQTPLQAKFFYALFAMPEKRAYRHLDFGNYMTLMLLDSGHTASVDGQQKEWLSNTLSARKGFTHKFAVYHVPAYPSVRRENYKYSVRIRNHWVPIFEENDLDVAFEHHDHSYKRTHKIRKNNKNPSGILYLGDGAWSPGHTRSRKRPSWYIAKQASRRHFINAYISEDERRFFAISDRGQLIDNYKEAVTSPLPQ